jgi:light-regulated signal transduction histidine kinase (bacteriophytochrome)
VKAALSELAEQYELALEDYLARAGEAALEGAYRVGRRALADALGVMELSAIHREALGRVLRDCRTAEECARAAAVATGFFAESLAPYEMALRGFRESSEQLRLANEALEQRRSELAAANKELEAFTYSVSHDLRAPLRHVDGFSKLLLEECSEGLPEEAHRYLTEVREGTRRMGQMVDDLLKLTRLGRSELSVQLTGLNSLLKEVLHDLKPELEGRQIEWRLSQLPFVECDPALMKQVLANLLSNALKFTRLQERTVIEVGMTTQDGSPVIFVRDNGVGFSMKYADKLFGVFQRLHRPEDFEGTGVGLATVQRIVHKHRGRVWAEAELNRGATFYFTLGQPERQGMENNSKVGGAV